MPHPAIRHLYVRDDRGHERRCRAGLFHRLSWLHVRRMHVRRMPPQVLLPPSPQVQPSVLLPPSPQVQPSVRLHWRGMPRRARARLREGGKTHGRSDDAKHSGPFKVTRDRSMVLIGPKSVAIGSDRSVRVEKAKRERAKYKVARLPAATAAVGWNCRYKNPTPIFVFPPYDVVWPVHTICIEDKLECIRDLADFDTGADRERIMHDAVGGNAGETNDLIALSTGRRGAPRRS
jgi:hypothetical protein